MREAVIECLEKKSWSYTKLNISKCKQCKRHPTSIALARFGSYSSSLRLHVSHTYIVCGHWLSFDKKKIISGMIYISVSYMKYIPHFSIITPDIPPWHVTRPETPFLEMRGPEAIWR